MGASTAVTEVKGTAEGSGSSMLGPQGLRQVCQSAQGPRKARLDGWSEIFAQKLTGWAVGGLSQQRDPDSALGSPAVPVRWGRKEASLGL